MEAVPSTPRSNGRTQDTAEYLNRNLCREGVVPPHLGFLTEIARASLYSSVAASPSSSNLRATLSNNHHTRHLAMGLIHLVGCLQEPLSTSAGPLIVYTKAVNAAHPSSVFLKYLVDNSKSDNFNEFYRTLDGGEVATENIQGVLG
ncbi:PREDICTED: uncharacterized protein LOC104613221 [Nelumbo nucifera]|uniref:Uncharacterized protein LOC104613221 n=1 Tax=Nelumbo nucifera TaxID=4432 RepID=A0A1U8BGF6_NELNU|nr:PREDICTED: uncharacterized protein LOC104613221 [Nelumbo nucifera]